MPLIQVPPEGAVHQYRHPPWGRSGGGLLHQELWLCPSINTGGRFPWNLRPKGEPPPLSLLTHVKQAPLLAEDSKTLSLIAVPRTRQHPIRITFNLTISYWICRDYVLYMAINRNLSKTLWWSGPLHEELFSNWTSSNCNWIPPFYIFKWTGIKWEKGWEKI